MQTACHALVQDSNMDANLQVGDRVRLSELGRRGSRRPGRTGVVLAISRSGSQCTIMWDGVRSAQVVYFSFLERASDALAPSASD